VGGEVAPSTGSEKCWLPICNRLRTRPGWVEPEIYFRIVHEAGDGHPGAPVADCREQTVEIVLGGKGAFENGNIGTLTRRVANGRAVRAVQPRAAKPRREPKTPRVTELLRKAIEWHRQLGAGEVANQADIARSEGITRARVTQVMGMLHLAPEIQQHILAMPDMVRRPSVTERMLRPIETISHRREQIREFHRFLG
jgi:hypothetical protein